MSQYDADDGVVEVLEGCTGVEILCETESGIWLPALTLKIDREIIDKTTFVTPLRLKARFIDYEFL